MGRALLCLLLWGVLSVQAIYPDGHFDHVTKIEDLDQMNAAVESSLDAGQTLMVRFIASAG